MGTQFSCTVVQGNLVLNRPIVWIPGDCLDAVAAGEEVVGALRVADQDVAYANATEIVRIDMGLFIIEGVVGV